MANLPDVYQIYQKDGQAVVLKDNEYFLSNDEPATWLLKQRRDEFFDINYDHWPDYSDYLVDKETVRTITTMFFQHKRKLENYENIYPIETMQPLLNALKEEKDSLIRLSEAFTPMGKEKINMKENEVAVKFYEGYVSKEKVTLKQGENTVKMTRVKMPNDDPNDTTVRRSFIVRESSIGIDTKNPHMRFVYLNKLDKDGNEVQYRVVRKNFDPETKQSEIIEDIKMTAQEIADVFQNERDRQYAEYKASKNTTEDDIPNEYDDPEETIETSDGIGL